MIAIPTHPSRFNDFNPHHKHRIFYRESMKDVKIRFWAWVGSFRETPVLRFTVGTTDPNTQASKDYG